ncbi:glycosyltransferase [Salipiger thiooxidans]|uniref:glycosyltransferase n=1 Tax=Salipiger thiooxidans TaxID=282683 RepID=UPI001CD3E429|nr:glycosyltransferase [Salipiger thiooxidans]MCA0850843.1 glycosyltransferase [Salipiger thiooxidans]
MRIAVIGHVRFPIARPFMGGMESHCWHLCRGLRARGHHVTLFAAGDSDWGGPVVPILPEHYDRSFPWHRWNGTPELNAHLDGGFAAILPKLVQGRFDVIHNNALHRFPPRFARRDRLAMVTSLHVPPFDVLQRAVVDSGAPWARFTVCSGSQLSAWWPTGRRETASVVPNGIDPMCWPFQPEGNGEAVWIGRITRTKGPHLAVEAARRAGIALTLYGTIEDSGYFDTRLRPLLGGDIRYGGHLVGKALARAVGKASVLVFTPLWDEPFGLAAIEAMSCGLPVAATDMGAAREVIGEAGRFAPPDPDALAGAIQEACAIPRTCARARVAANFTHDRMLDGYEAQYSLARAGLPSNLPLPDFPPHALPPANGAQDLAAEPAPQKSHA